MERKETEYGEIGQNDDPGFVPLLRKGKKYMSELEKEHPEYADVKVEVVDELVHPEIADKLDYWYVPTYFIDGVKVHEGAASKEDVDKVYKEALS